MVGMAKSHLGSNPIPTRNTQTYLVPQGPREWDRTVSECLLRRDGSAVDCCRGRGSGCSRLGYGISPLGRGHHYPCHRATGTYTGLGNRLLKGTNRTLCAPAPRRKEQWPKRLTQTCRCMTQKAWALPGRYHRLIPTLERGNLHAGRVWLVQSLTARRSWNQSVSALS